MSASNEVFVKLLANCEAVLKNPEEFIRLQNELADVLQESMKRLYEFSKSNELINIPASVALPELIINGFDTEQIFQQLELHNNAINGQLIKGISKLLKCNKKDCNAVESLDHQTSGGGEELSEPSSIEQSETDVEDSGDEDIKKLKTISIFNNDIGKEDSEFDYYQDVPSDEEYDDDDIEDEEYDDDDIEDEEYDDDDDDIEDGDGDNDQVKRKEITEHRGSLSFYNEYGQTNENMPLSPAGITDISMSETMFSMPEAPPPKRIKTSQGDETVNKVINLMKSFLDIQKNKEIKDSASAFGELVVTSMRSIHSVARQVAVKKQIFDILCNVEIAEDVERQEKAKGSTVVHTMCES